MATGSSKSLSRPSIFEILAQESLANGMRDAFRHLCKILAENFPARYGTLLQYFEEYYTVLNFLFLCVHFRVHGATFAEHFYGLKRIPDPRCNLVPFRKIVIWTLFAAVFPYLRLQSENLFKTVREWQANGILVKFKGNVQKAALLYKSLYPAIHFTWETVILCYYMAYAMDRSNFHSPLLHVTATKLTLADSEEALSQLWEENLAKKHKFIFPVLWKGIRTLVGGVSISIAVGAYFLEFLEWWYARENGSTSLCPLPVPPPPSKWPHTIPPNLCPICQKRRTNDTVLSCSGFVFCYPCIFKFVKENSACPVTGYPATIEQLVKIYHEANKLY